MDQGSFQRVVELFQIPGRPAAPGFGGLGFLNAIGITPNIPGFGGGPGGGAVPPGDYLVSLTVGGRTMKQKVRVERAP
jgi:hypothetical protein